ncbi:universal stress protein [Bosea sp. 117]|uniref:universal stress protein n=1 Tax=Bosea sp. 117 TaxID=1125973 RepID=UPI000493FE90|nr:universal stress protein [Bosea sp. 117]
MAVRTILLHAAPDSGFADRLAFAVRLARQTGATLVGLYTLYPTGVPRVGRALSIYINELKQEARAKEAELRRSFETAVAEARISAEWRTVEGEVTEALKEAAYFADVAVVSETVGGTMDDDLASTMPEHLPLLSDGPVIVVPTGKPVPASIGRVLIAWKPSREAGHAVRFALPLLALADKVEVLTVDEPGVDSAGGGALATHLASHGVKAEHKHIEAGYAEKAIRAEAAEFKPDLLVLGAYSRPRLAEFVLGGVTRSMLDSAPAPLFFAH